MVDAKLKMLWDKTCGSSSLLAASTITSDKAFKSLIYMHFSYWYIQVMHKMMYKRRTLSLLILQFNFLLC